MIARAIFFFFSLHDDSRETAKVLGEPQFQAQLIFTRFSTRVRNGRNFIWLAGWLIGHGGTIIPQGGGIYFFNRHRRKCDC